MKTFVRCGQLFTGREDAARAGEIMVFDERGMMTGCDVVDGRELESAIGKLFAEQQAAYLHVHFARAGCYAARVDRC